MEQQGGGKYIRSFNFCPFKMQITVVSSLKDFLWAANIDYIVYYCVKSTCLGYAIVGCIDKYLCYLQFMTQAPADKGLSIIEKAFPEAKHSYKDNISDVLDFENLQNCDEIAIIAQGTPFQEKVWRALFEIPKGTTVFYSDLATMAGVPDSIRACASAVGKNPVALLLPCHRVIGKNGNICKFGAGETMKRRLWKFEGIDL